MFHTTDFSNAVLIQPVAPLMPVSAELRALGKADTPAIVAHLLRLGERSRRLRFGTPVNDGFISAYVEAGDAPRRTGLIVDGTLRGLAELHLDPADPTSGEAAFSIETPFRGTGHGTRLFGALLADAQEAGLSRVTLQCLRENVAMQRIARRFASELSFHGSETVATLRVPASVPALVAPVSSLALA